VSSWSLRWLREWLSFISYQLAILRESLDSMNRCNDQLAELFFHGLLLDLKLCEFSLIMRKVHTRVHFLLDIFHNLLKSRPMQEPGISGFPVSDILRLTIDVLDFKSKSFHIFLLFTRVIMLATLEGIVIYFSFQYFILDCCTLACLR
jgi:hypothetical protein